MGEAYNLLNPADQATTDSYVTVAGSVVDTVLAEGLTALAWQLSEVGGTNGVTFKIRGAIERGNWVDLKTLDETETLRAGADIAVAASGVAYAFVTDGDVKWAFRYYDVQVKSTVAGLAGTARVRFVGK